MIITSDDLFFAEELFNFYLIDICIKKNKFYTIFYLNLNVIIKIDIKVLYFLVFLLYIHKGVKFVYEYLDEFILI